MAEFKTTRMTDNTPVADVDNHVQALEDSFVYFFGAPTGQTLTGKVFPGLDASGNITGIVRSAAAANSAGNAGPGWRSRDTGNNDEVLVMCEDGYLRVFENTGSQSSPTWTERNKLDLSTGKWEKGSSEGAYTGALLVDVYDDTHDYRTGDFVEWDGTDFDDSNYFSTSSRTRVTIPATGRYRMHWSLFVGSEPAKTFTHVSVYAGLQKNGSTWIYDANAGSGNKDAISATYYPGVGVSGHWAAECSAGDYFRLYAFTEGLGDYAGQVHSGHWQIERIN